MYKKILVPHAGSPAGDEALKHAIHIAKLNSAKIIILHVLEDLPNLPLLIHQEQIQRIKQQMEEVEETMKKTMEKEMAERIQLCEKEGIKTDLKIVTGFPEDGILEIVKNQKIDLIVMGKRKKLKGIKRLMVLGSVSRRILEHTSCPVLMIDIEKK
jgi:nucleotide-binding universal stress UspA family protein